MEPSRIRGSISKEGQKLLELYADDFYLRDSIVLEIDNDMTLLNDKGERELVLTNRYYLEPDADSIKEINFEKCIHVTVRAQIDCRYISKGWISLESNNFRVTW